FVDDLLLAHPPAVLWRVEQAKSIAGREADVVNLLAGMGEEVRVSWADVLKTDPRRGLGLVVRVTGDDASERPEAEVNQARAVQAEGAQPTPQVLQPDEAPRRREDSVAVDLPPGCHRVDHAAGGVQPAVAAAGQADPNTGRGVLQRRQHRGVRDIVDERFAARTTTDGSGLHRDDRGAVGRDWGGADVGAWDPPGVAARVQLRRLPQGDDLQPVASFRDDVDRLTEEELAESP